MQANKGRDTKPEKAVRRAVHALGLRYNVSVRPIPTLRRTADMVFPRLKIAVFVDGCFWHGCPQHFSVSKTNAKFWANKIERTRERDTETNDALQRAGWTVIRVWEHESPTGAAHRIQEVVRDLKKHPSR